MTRTATLLLGALVVLWLMRRSSGAAGVAVVTVAAPVDTTTVAGRVARGFRPDE